MSRKILAVIFTAVLIFSVAVITVTAVPYIDGGIRISGERTYIEAVHFDGGVNGINFRELGYRGHGEAYALRPEFAEEHSGPQTEFGESGFAGNIGWTQGGEWVQYTVYVETAGRYGVRAYLASGSGDAGNIEVSYNNNIIGETASWDTMGWQIYDWYDVGEADLEAGAGVIRVEFFTGDTNFAALEVTLIETASDPEPPEYAERIWERDDLPDILKSTGESSFIDHKTVIIIALILIIGLLLASIVVLGIAVDKLSKKINLINNKNGSDQAQ